MGLFAQLIESGQGSGEIIIEKPENTGNNNPQYPKGIQLTVDFFSKNNYEMLTFYPRCEVAQVFTDAQIVSLKQQYCPNCNRLEWRDNRLVPVYKYFSIPAMHIISNKVEATAFPIDYVEYEKLDMTYYTKMDNNVTALYAQYLNNESSIRRQIEGAISLINKDNPVFKELLIYQEMMQNVFKYFDRGVFSISTLKLPDYLKLRAKVVSAHSELNY